MNQYHPPFYRSKSFHCPYCQVFAMQSWGTRISPFDWSWVSGQGHSIREGNAIKVDGENVEVSFCSSCSSPTLWIKKEVAYPIVNQSPPANTDLPDDIKKVYIEAGAISQHSPRAACALLRLAIEMLLRHLGETGTINDGIKNLVKKGLDPMIEQSLEIVRVTGNNAVHPGMIKFNDASDVLPLFELINLIADSLLTRPKKVRELHNRLPKRTS